MPVNLTVGWVGLVAFCLLATPAATAQSADELPGHADTPIVSTRGHFDPETRKLKEGIGPTSYQVLGHVPGLMGGRCPPRLITFVHGYDKGETSAIESFDIAEASFSDPVVGFSWDSETGFWLSPFNFWDATQIADRNGQKLARFLVDYADQCPKTGLHLVGHSLGARIVLRTVEVFYQRGGPKVETVQLIGAAVEDDIFAKLDLIEPVETKVDRIVNYFNRRDGTLRWALFGLFDMPLGQQGIDGTMPANYREVDVTCCVGTNHRTPFYLDVAAKLMNDVIQGDWNDASTEIRNAPRVLGKARTGKATRERISDGVGSGSYHHSWASIWRLVIGLLPSQNPERDRWFDHIARLSTRRAVGAGRGRPGRRGRRT